MSERGVTRELLQGQCVVPPVTDTQNLRSYFNAARQLVIQGESYYMEGELAQAYVYMKRFLHLAYAGMPKHKKYTKDIFANDRVWLTRERERVFPILEIICTQLDDADDRRACAQATVAAAAAASGSASAAAAAEENKRKASSTDFGTTLGYSLDDLPEAPTGHPSLPSSSSSSKSIGNPGMTPGSSAAGAAVPQPQLSATLPPLYPPPAAAAAGAYVPSAPPPPPSSSEGNFYNGYGAYGGGGTAAVSGPGYGGGGVVGGVVPGGAVGLGVGVGVGVGVGGAAALQDAFRTLSLDQGVSAGGHYPSVPQPERRLERPSMERGISAFGTERKVVLPSTLVAEFEKIAKPNTDLPPYGIETCGILAGRLTHNELQMTTLIIPKQKGTSDSVETTNETELFNYMLPNKLITLGWIHTHPKQECFMSSVDVHTHCGYQLMLPEAVAVVYAPCDNKKRVGVFRLTQPDGMKLIQECELKGFHQHPGNIKIYEQADLEWKPVKMTITDLR